jgi:hypothetical protein
VWYLRSKCSKNNIFLVADGFSFVGKLAPTPMATGDTMVFFDCDGTDRRQRATVGRGRASQLDVGRLLLGRQATFWLSAEYHGLEFGYLSRLGFDDALKVGSLVSEHSCQLSNTGIFGYLPFTSSGMELTEITQFDHAGSDYFIG